MARPRGSRHKVHNNTALSPGVGGPTSCAIEPNLHTLNHRRDPDSPAPPRTNAVVISRGRSQGPPRTSCRFGSPRHAQHGVWGRGPAETPKAKFASSDVKNVKPGVGDKTTALSNLD